MNFQYQLNKDNKTTDKIFTERSTESKMSALDQTNIQLQPGEQLAASIL